MPYFKGSEAGLSLGFDLDMGKRVHEPMGVREAVYPYKAPSGSREKPAAVYLCRPLYGCKPLYLHLALYL